MSTLNYILHIKSWGLYISILLPWYVVNHHWDLQHKSVYITQELQSILFSFHWQESETHFISKKKKLHFNYWRSLNKSIIISRMYIYTTTTNCPLATQPPPDSTYHCSFDLSFKPDPVDIGFINRRCPSQIQTWWTFMKISQIGDFVYFFSQCRPLENQICTFKKPSI